MGAVNDRESMGAELLPVAGCRSAYQVLIKNKALGAELLTNVSPTLTAWLRELVSLDCLVNRGSLRDIWLCRNLKNKQNWLQNKYNV